MAINLIVIDTIKRPVTLNAPNGTDITIEGVEFTYMEPDAYLKLAEKEGSDHQSIFNDLVVGWDDFLDADGKQIKPTKAHIKELLTSPWVLQGFVLTYERAIYGYDSKNFMTSLAVGQAVRAQASKKQIAKKKPRARKAKR